MALLRALARSAATTSPARSSLLVARRASAAHCHPHHRLAISALAYSKTQARLLSTSDLVSDSTKAKANVGSIGSGQGGRADKDKAKADAARDKRAKEKERKEKEKLKRQQQRIKAKEHREKEKEKKRQSQSSPFSSPGIRWLLTPPKSCDSPRTRTCPRSSAQSHRGQEKVEHAHRPPTSQGPAQLVANLL